MHRDYGKPTAREIEVMTTAEADALLSAGHFGIGSMSPKIEAAIEFVRASKDSQAEVLITSCERAADGFAGRIGTRVVRG